MTFSNLRKDKPLFEYLLRLGDDRLVLSHRMSQWCGHGPILEEDIAMANIALDELGQAKAFLDKAAEVEGEGRTADDLTYLRNEREFRNVQLVEQENGDFAYSMCRQFFFDVFDVLFYQKLAESKDEDLAAMAAKNIKESKYHLRHSSEWIKKLGDGTEESHERLKYAVDFLWMYTGELFDMDEVDEQLLKDGIAVDLYSIKDEYYKIVNNILEEATIGKRDPEEWMQTGGREGKHSEYLGHILAELQYLPRSMPDAKW